jgi:hypothetical protein
MHEAAASCKDIVRAPVTNWEPQCVTLAGYYAVRYGMKVQLLTPYRVTHLQRYEVTLQVCTHPKRDDSPRAVGRFSVQKPS